MEKAILFITTKNLDYLRNTQEIEILQKESKRLEIIGSYSKKYLVRILRVYFQLLLINVKKYDVVFIGFAPQLVLPFWKSKFRKQRIVIDFFISLYDTFVFDRKRFEKDSLASKLLWKLDAITLNNSDVVISDTKTHGAYFVKEFGLDEEKLKVLYLKADSSIFYPRNMSRPDRMDGKYVVLYFGSALPLQGIPIILRTVELLMRHKDIYFVIIGPIGKKYEKPSGENIEYHNWLSQKELAEYIGYADLCLAGHFDADIEKAKRTIPGKAYIYRAMNKSMILGDNEANRELFSPNDSGIYYVKMGDEKALAERIVEVKELS